MLPNFNDYGPCYELFSSATDIIKNWKFKGKINKEFESHSKSNYYYLQFGGVSAISIPINEKHSLQISNSALIFQFSLVNTKSFSIEIGIKDTANLKKRINFSTSVKEIEINSLHAKIPMGQYPLNIWSTLLIDIYSLTSQCFKNTFKNIENIRITGCMKIRKIYSLKNKNEPVMKNIEMGKAIPSVNLIISNINELIVCNTNLQFIGNNNNLNNTSNLNNANNNNNNSNNNSKFYTPHEINRNKMYYRKKEPSNDKINKAKMEKEKEKDLSDAMTISPLIEYKNNDSSLSKKTKENLRFAKRMPNISKVKNEIKYGIEKNKNNKNVNINKIMGFNAIEEGEEIGETLQINKNIDNINKKDRGKSIGRTTMPNKNKETKKRNKSNNPYNRPEKIYNNKIKIENYNENDSMSNQDLVKINNNNSYKNDSSNNNIDSKKTSNKDIIIEDFNEKDETNKKNEQIKQTSSLGFPVSNNKFKFNNITLTNSIMKKDEEVNLENSEKLNNKYSNYDILEENNFDFKNIPIFDSIEDVTDWSAIDNNINNNAAAKMGDKLIKLESSVINHENKNKNNNINNEKDIYNVTGSDFLEISTLINQKKDSERPYTPPMGKLVPVDPSKTKENKVMNSIDKKNNILKMSTNTNRLLKNYENLIYDPSKGYYYDPKANIYYDIKSPSG